MTEESALELESLYTTITQIYRSWRLLNVLFMPVYFFWVFMYSVYFLLLGKQFTDLKAVENSRPYKATSSKSRASSSGKCFLCSPEDYIAYCPSQY